jgi:hypothetical protein
MSRESFQMQERDFAETCDPHDRSHILWDALLAYIERSLHAYRNDPGEQDCVRQENLAYLLPLMARLLGGGRPLRVVWDDDEGNTHDEVFNSVNLQGLEQLAQVVGAALK